MIDVVANGGFIRGNKNDSRYYQTRLIASGVLAWAYVLAFLRILSFTKANRRFGPLQISLMKILANVFDFLFIFSLIIFSFGMGLTELFWYHRMELNSSRNYNISKTNASCYLSEFDGLGKTLAQLFWSLFGYLDVEDYESGSCKKNYFVIWNGLVLLGAYHVAAVIVILNMLIAMMAISFQKISNEKEAQWKFHSTALWIYYFQKSCTLPPPMNLIPNPISLFRKFKHIQKKIWNFSCFEQMKEFIISKIRKALNIADLCGKQQKNEGPILEESSDIETGINGYDKNTKAYLAKNVEFKLLERFKVKYLLKKKLE